MKVRITLFFLVLAFNAFFSGAFTSTVMPSADRIARILIVLGDVLMLVMAFTCLMRNKSFYGVKYLVAFVIISALTYIYNSYRVDLPAQLNGLREPLFFFSCLIVIHDVFQSDKKDAFVKFFTVFLITFALVQTPLSVIQFIQHGAGDHVGGTYGFGGSGLVSQLLFLICFYLSVRYGSLEDQHHLSVSKVILFSVLLIPCALNETKISFLLLPSMFIFMLLTRKKAYRAIPFLLFGVVLASFLVYYYDKTVENPQDVFDPAFIEKYLWRSQGEEDLPRFQKLEIMFRLMGHDVGAILLGMGYGLFGGSNILGVSRVGRSLYYMSGSRIMLFTVWIQGGLIAVLAMGGAVFSFIKSKQVLSPVVKRFAWFLFFSLLASWFYNEAVLDRVFTAIASFLMIWIHTGGDEENIELPIQSDELVDESTHMAVSS